MATFSTNVSLTPGSDIFYTAFASNSVTQVWARPAEYFITGEVTVQATDPIADESGDPGAFTVTRPAGLIGGGLTVNYTVAGTASPGADYQPLSGSVFIPPGQASATIPVWAIADLDPNEPDESVRVDLAGGAYTIGVPNQAEVIIRETESTFGLGSMVKITFCGYPRNEPLINFPALVVLSTNVSGFAYSQFAPNGEDLRFLDASQTMLLPHEIESWSTNGDSLVWVRVPSLTSNACIYAFWGDPSATAHPVYSTNGATWSENYEAVWHLDRTNAAGRFVDATANRHDGLDVGTLLATGVVGLARTFDGTNSYIDAEDNFLSFLPQFTLSVWASGAFDQTRAGFVGQNDAIEFGPDLDVALWTERGGGLLNGSPLPNFTWHHISVSGDGSFKRMYYDGVQNTFVGGTAADYGDSGFNVRIGGGGIWDPTGNYFDGMMDEVRI
ncbi:MAG: DUF2341 domain-containing protein, partial [Verrucomicrobiota bacterium]